MKSIAPMFGNAILAMGIAILVYSIVTRSIHIAHVKGLEIGINKYMKLESISIENDIVSYKLAIDNALKMKSAERRGRHAHYFNFTTKISSNLRKQLAVIGNTHPGGTHQEISMRGY